MVQRGRGINQMPLPDKDVTFFMQISHEGDYAVHSANRLRQLYQGSRIILRSDGKGLFNFDPHIIDVEFYDEEPLFAVENGGAAIHRMFEIYFSKPPSRYLIKIDPDTLFHRKLSSLPKGTEIFGTIQELDGCRSIQGGFIGFPSVAARKIYRSALLLSPELTMPRASDGAFMGIMQRRAVRVGLSSFDWSIGWAAEALGIGLFNFPEVHSTWKDPPTNPNGKFAVTHPDPNRPFTSR